MCFTFLTFLKKNKNHEEDIELDIKVNSDFSSGTSYESESDDIVNIYAPNINTNPNIKLTISPDHINQRLHIYDKIVRLDNIFYVAHFNNQIILFYNNNQTKLPLDGWLQKCIKCGTITGRKNLYKKTTGSHIYVKMCSKCIHNFKIFPNNNLEIKKEIDEILVYLKT